MIDRRYRIHERESCVLCGLETARDSADLIGNRISVYIYLYVPRLRKKMNYVLEEDQVMMRLTNIISRYQYVPLQEKSCS